MSKVPANWGRLKDAVSIRDKMGSQTLIIGNGDLTSVEEGRKKAKETGADGVMFGRGIFGNPWFFNPEKEFIGGVNLPVRGKTEGESVLYSNQSISPKEKLEALLEHIELFDQILSKTKNFAVMKKHFKAYISGFSGAKELREELMKTNNLREAKEVIDRFSGEQC